MSASSDYHDPMDAIGEVRDIAQPPGIDATLRTLGGVVFALQPQGSLDEVAATTQMDGNRVVGVSLSYSYFRRPADRRHPDNFVALTAEQAAAIDRAEAANLPPWLIEQISRIRYPTLWDAVRTSKARPGERLNALEARLVAHANDVLRASAPERPQFRVAHHGTGGRVRPDDLLESVVVIVDGVPCRGRRLDAGAHVVALGARVDDRYMTAVYDSRIAPGVRAEFVRRPFADGAEVRR